VQATAIDNLLRDQRVIEAPAATAFTGTAAGAMVAAALVLLPRRTLSKLLGSLLATAMVVGTAFYLFVGARIQWLPLAAPLLALLLATVGAFAYSYYTEDRHRRAIVKVFSQYVSPQMAAEIERDPARIRLSGDRQVMTVMFTDIAGFTTLSERLPDEVLTETLNFYFDQMSPLVFAEDGYLDKYIGDAIMGFWNAPLPQPDHAHRACRAALAMERRERAIQPEMVRRGVDECLTRIGINTGPMVVGDMGSRDRFNYTVLGDSVNLGARLEGANKFYGSRILMSQATADLVRTGSWSASWTCCRSRGSGSRCRCSSCSASGARRRPTSRPCSTGPPGTRRRGRCTAGSSGGTPRPRCGSCWRRTRPTARPPACSGGWPTCATTRRGRTGTACTWLKGSEACRIEGGRLPIRGGKTNGAITCERG
jgi:class 3 adenylate cyclase